MSVDDEAHRGSLQPREWFTVLFGGRLFRSERTTANRFTDSLQNICLEEGLLLCDRPHCNMIIVDDDVNEVMDAVRKTIIDIIDQHPEGDHMPLIFAIDDQTLLEFHEEYLSKEFGQDAFIYSFKAARVKAFVAMEDYEQVRSDIRQLQAIVDEYNPLPAKPPPPPPSRHMVPERYRNDPPAVRSDHQHRRHREHGDHEPEPKRELTPEMVRTVLANVQERRSLLLALAEDIDQNAILPSRKQQLPERKSDLLRLLRLLVLATEHSPRKDAQSTEERKAGKKLRKRIAETMLTSSLLREVHAEFVDGLHDRLADDRLSDSDILLAADAISLLLRAFVQLGAHNIFDDAALDLWGQLEAPVFGLPGRFWRTLPAEDVEEMCKVAAEVTSNDPSTYKDCVRKAIGRKPAASSSRDDRPRRNGHREEQEDRRDDRRRPPSDAARQVDRDERGGEGGRRQDRAGTSSSPYRYDPYEMDESDTTEVYEEGGGAAPVDMSGWETPTEDNLVEEEAWAEQRKQQEMREMERRRQQEEEAAEQRRALERRQHAQAMMQLERKRWEESQDTCIAWHDNDGTEPPVSFRTLANRPVYSDLYQPKAPYMRKALVTGAYSDNEHYLDVQFRLMREDMVATLRDGIYNQKMMQTDRRQLITSNNEIKVYPTIQVGALQVRTIDGHPMRIVSIPQHMLSTIRDERQLKFGQCVVVSSDQFERDFHVGWICERFQEPGMPWQGRIAISFFDECHPVRRGYTPIDKSATYAIVESSSAYLEAYRHVLRVLKKMRKNVPFPLERYLVHMKKNTRLPQYMRGRVNEEDAAEDKERQIFYAKKMAEASALEKEKEKKKKERQSRSASRNDEGGVEEEEAHVTTEEGVSEENVADNDEDDGFNSDEEDVFLTGGRHVHPNPKDLETIAIRGHSYKIASLEADFKPEFLDETQRKAMCYALTSELAIIQGPPGTGKTHIGVEIVMAILENRIKWRMTEPILIVTFSNQALDHFLDKIRVQIEERGLGNEEAPSVVRLGSRSDHDAIKLNCLLSTVMRDYEEALGGEANTEKFKTRKLKQACLTRLVRAVKTVQLSKTSILQYNTLRQVMDPSHDQQFRQAMLGMLDTAGNPLNLDEVLVSWLLNKTYERRRDLPPGSDDSDEDDSKEEKQWGGGSAAMRAHETKPVHKKKKQAGGRETKKEKNERKRAERRGQYRDNEDSSDDEEDEDESPTELPANDVNDGEESDEDVRTGMEELEALISKFNAANVRQQQGAASEEKWKRMEKYEMEVDWEAEREYAMRNNGRPLVDDVEIFSRTTKPGLNLARRERKQINVDPNIVRDIEEQKAYILSKEALPIVEAREIRDVRTLPKERRWRLLVRWQESLATAHRDNLDMYCRQHEIACERAEAAADVSRAAVCKRALVVGATTTGSAKRRALISRIAPKVLVVEEAAEVLEAHLLASIVPSVQHAIFIGDHQQLRPSTAVHTLAKLANMEVSLFERLVKNGYPFHTLGLQHRMLTPLTQHVVRPFFYNALEDAPSVREYPDVRGMATNLFFWAHNVSENTVLDSMSKKNIVEAEMCRNLANYILLQGQYKASEITIIGMYGAQVLAIKDLIKNAGGQVADVAVETVDSFQGKENRVMILSLVRSNSGGVGFLAIANRITVALTRAQHGMYVVGNFADIANYSDMWHNIVNSLNGAGLIDYALPVVCQRHGRQSTVKINQDFIRCTPFGGCTDRCDLAMSCGHTCKHVCHPPHQHEGYVQDAPDLTCRERCNKACHKCGAACQKGCQEPCGTCHAVVLLELDCGHTVRCECGARNLARCKEPCETELQCGHMCQNKCSVECVTVERCETGVQIEHPVCHHILVLPCNVVRPVKFGQAPVPPCYEPCPERLVCGHKCPRNCGEKCPTMCEAIVQFEGACGHRLQKKCSEEARHIKCTALVKSEMPHCTHRIMMECHQARDQNQCRSSCKKLTSCGHECSLSCGECFKKASAHECADRCTRELACGHRCQGRCGKPCVCLASCRVRCVHQRCGATSNTRGGSVAYNRQCGQPCALCTERCENHCEHRQCSKRCFEECDIKAACIKPCGKMLNCGHGCIGLCGETCPSVCPTCNTVKYRQIIEQYPDDEVVGKELPRLLQMPECGHVFPYKYVDKCVRTQLEEGAIVLRCPRCGDFIDGCKRYMRQTKRMWAEADTRKWEAKWREDGPANRNQEYRKMLSELETQQSVVVAHFKTIKKTGLANQKFPVDAYKDLENLFIHLRQALSLANSSDEQYFYWQEMIKCHRMVCFIVAAWIDSIDLNKIDSPPHDLQPQLKEVMFVAFDCRRMRFHPHRDHFRGMLDLLRESLGDRRVGLLVPRARTAFIKSHLYFHLEQLNWLMRGQLNERGEVLDLTVQQAMTYKRVIRLILSAKPTDHPQKLLEDLMAKLHSDVYPKLLTSAPSSRVWLGELPEF